MNTFLNGLTNATNYTYTENGALIHKTTRSALLDMFALGGAYRSRSDEDCILLFKNAYEENPLYAIRCLFYLRDVRGGQGERRFFRVCVNWLAQNANIENIIALIPEYGRWDDLYAFVDTAFEEAALAVMKEQLALDVECNTPSLLAKWMKSENASSTETRRLASITRQYLGMTHKQYRRTLSILRKRINIVETLMSQNRWDEIEFDKIPSRAGFIYKNAFAKHDIERVRAGVQSYQDFALDETTTVNADILYPYECVAGVVKNIGWRSMDISPVERAMINKYWDNLADYFNNAEFNALAVVDTSGSMTSFNNASVQPIHVAISLGLYCAEKAKGPFAGHYVSFSSRPQLIRTEGIDFCDKVNRIYQTNLCENTDIEATFDMLLDTALLNRCAQEDLPQNLVIISDMEFDTAQVYSHRITETLMEMIARRWEAVGYKMPHLIFWNVDARQNNIPMLGNGRISYVSGFSPAIFETLMSGKSGYDLMMEKLDSERYASIIL